MAKTHAVRAEAPSHTHVHTSSLARPAPRTRSPVRSHGLGRRCVYLAARSCAQASLMASWAESRWHQRARCVTEQLFQQLEGASLCWGPLGFCWARGAGVGSWWLGSTMGGSEAWWALGKVNRLGICLIPGSS